MRKFRIIRKDDGYYIEYKGIFGLWLDWKQRNKYASLLVALGSDSALFGIIIVYDSFESAKIDIDKYLGYISKFKRIK